mgnify:CR=1 FL=1
MFNYQSIAVRIEHALQSHGYAKMGDADAIRSNPMAFMDTVLKRYEKMSEEHNEKSADFWEVYKNYEGRCLDEFGEEMARNFANDIVDLFH